jgi:hypothetical protein
VFPALVTRAENFSGTNGLGRLRVARALLGRENRDALLKRLNSCRSGAHSRSHRRAREILRGNVVN